MFKKNTYLVQTFHKPITRSDMSSDMIFQLLICTTLFKGALYYYFSKYKIFPYLNIQSHVKCWLKNLSFVYSHYLFLIFRYLVFTLFLHVLIFMNLFCLEKKQNGTTQLLMEKGKCYLVNTRIQESFNDAIVYVNKQFFIFITFIAFLFLVTLYHLFF